MHTLIAAARLNDINPQTWLADVLARIADHPASRLHELLPWNWKANQDQSCRRLITGPPRSLAAGYGSLHAGLLAAAAAGVGRRDQQRRKLVRDGSQFLALASDLPGADIGAAGHLANPPAPGSWQQSPASVPPSSAAAAPSR